MQGSTGRSCGKLALKRTLAADLSVTVTHQKQPVSSEGRCQADATSTLEIVVPSLSRVPTCNPMDCSTPGSLPFTISRSLTPRVCSDWVGDAIRPPHPLALNFSQASLESDQKVISALLFYLLSVWLSHRLTFTLSPAKPLSLSHICPHIWRGGQCLLWATLSPSQPSTSPLLGGMRPFQEAGCRALLGPPRSPTAGARLCAAAPHPQPLTTTVLLCNFDFRILDSPY